MLHPGYQIRSATTYKLPITCVKETMRARQCFIVADKVNSTKGMCLAQITELAVTTSNSSEWPEKFSWFTKRNCLS